MIIKQVYLWTLLYCVLLPSITKHTYQDNLFMKTTKDTTPKNRDFSESVGACDKNTTSLSCKFTMINTISFADYPKSYRLVQLNDIGDQCSPRNSQ